MDFAKTMLFIVPTGNSLPTTGSTNNLTAAQFGIFRSDYSVATAANIAASQYIYLAQGRIESITSLGTKVSDKIYKGNVIDMYKVTGSATATAQITHVSGFDVACGETATVTLRLFSTYINTGFMNGLTRSVTIKTPCCDCGDDPCTTVDAEGLVDLFVTGINAEPRLSQFVTASKSGSGSSAILVITGKALTTYGNACDLTAFSFEYDRMNFLTYAYKGPENTQDYEAFDSCDTFATVAITQKSTYATGLPAEIKQLEKNWYSFQTYLRSIFKDPIFNDAFTSYVDSTVTAYTTLYIKFKDATDATFSSESSQCSMVVIAAPATEAAAIQTRLELFFGAGAFIDKTSTN